MSEKKLTPAEVVSLSHVDISGYAGTREFHQDIKPGLNVIWGKNEAGKTSILAAIAGACGGANYVEDNPINDEYKEHEGQSKALVELDFTNGAKARRSFTLTNDKGSLTVKMPNGTNGNQTYLDSFVSDFALNLGRWMRLGDRDKVMALKDGGLIPDTSDEDNRLVLAMEEQTRQDIRKEEVRGHHNDLPWHEDVGTELRTVEDLTAELRKAVEYNQSNDAKRGELGTANAAFIAKKNERMAAVARKDDLAKRLAALQDELARAAIEEANIETKVTELEGDVEKKEQIVSGLVDIDVAPISI